MFLAELCLRELEEMLQRAGDKRPSLTTSLEQRCLETRGTGAYGAACPHLGLQQKCSGQ